jgi:YbbR domain-containing protein
MANEDNSAYRGDELHHLRRDSRDAHTNSQLAKWLSILAMILAAIALWVAVSALNKAGDAQSTANRATESVNQTQ